MIGRIQVYQWCRGIRQKHLYPDQILSFVFPLLDRRTMKIIDQKMKEAEDKRGRRIASYVKLSRNSRA